MLIFVRSIEGLNLIALLLQHNLSQIVIFSVGVVFVFKIKEFNQKILPWI